MNPTLRPATAVLFAAAAMLQPLPGQDVVLSEVRADTAGCWVEVHNRTAAPVDLSTSSLHNASRTPGLPQNYWWAFPAGTVLGADSFLRVHWYQPAPANAAPGELFTGDTHWDFLFSLGGEPLHAAAGAFGLFRSQLDSMMSTSSIVEDWVSWGDHGFQREPLAIANGRWTSNCHTTPVPDGGSLARNCAAIGLPGPHDQQWFEDGTPTPLAPNLADASTTAYGQGCAPVGHHLLGVPLLRAVSVPLLGNAQFGLLLDNTTGIYGEHVLIAWSLFAGAPGQPSVLPPTPGGCAPSVDLAQMIVLWLLPTQVITTDVPLSLAGAPAWLAGTELHAQALVLDLLPNSYPPYQGLSNALRIVFGQ